MEKKNGIMSNLYLIGMALVVIGFILPMFKVLGQLAALAVSIIGAIVLIIGFNDNVVYKAIGKGLIKHAYVGFYCIIVGWVAGILGYLKA